MIILYRLTQCRDKLKIFVMMDIFYTKLLLSFLLGGIWITLVTIAAEKLGSKVGGFVGGLPSTVVLSFFFIGWTQGQEQVFRATTVFPAAMAMNSIFLIFYVIFVKKGLILGIASGIFAWLTMQSLLFWVNLISFQLSIILWVLIFSGSYYLLEHKIGIPERERVKVNPTFLQLAFRALFSGTIVAFAVTMSKIGGPVLGGIFSSFPAVFISTLFISAKSVDVQFSRSLATPLMVSAVINCVVFAMVFRFIIYDFNLVMTTIFAYLASVISAYFTYIYIKKMTGNKKI